MTTMLDYMLVHSYVISYLLTLGVHDAFNIVGVDRISPRIGSLEGGTKVIVVGEGFSTDSYSGANLVFLGEHPCVVNW